MKRLSEQIEAGRYVKPDYSVVTPTYNEERFLHHNLPSVEVQSNEDIKDIVISVFS